MSDVNDIDELISKARKICHDINQPLTVIMARSELLLLKTAADDPSRRSMEQIHEQAEKISTFVDDLRALFKTFQGE